QQPVHRRAAQAHRHARARDQHADEARARRRDRGDAREAGALGSLLAGRRDRSEEHTSELQSLTNLVCRLLLEKKKKHQLRSHTCEAEKIATSKEKPQETTDVVTQESRVISKTNKDHQTGTNSKDSAYHHINSN